MSQPTKFWVQGTSLFTIANLINSQLRQDESTLQEAGPVDNHLGEEHNPQQHLRLNLV
jgi:hypothetical protein